MKPDGGIYRKGLANCDTSISLIALVLARDGKYNPVVRGAHDFVIGQQARGLPDRTMDGGMGMVRPGRRGSILTFRIP